MQPGCKSFAFPFVADGVSTEFFERVFQEQVAEWIFCIGQVAAGSEAGVIRRFPIERPGHVPLREALKKHLRSSGRLHFGAASGRT
jgi:hypothetical protein